MKQYTVILAAGIAAIVIVVISFGADLVKLSVPTQEYDIFVVYKNVNWINHIPASISNQIKSVERNIFSKIIRKIVLSIPKGLVLWRVLSKYIDPLYKQLYSLRPSVVFYPGGDSAAYEFDLPSIIPIFDLMHRYEPSFPEVSGKKLFKMREKHYSGVCKYATGILVDSDIGKDHVIESYNVSNEENIFVLPFIAPPYVRHQEEKINFYANNNLPQKYIFYPAQFWHHKNHLRLLKAIAQLKEKGTHDQKHIEKSVPIENQRRLQMPVKIKTDLSKGVTMLKVDQLKETGWNPNEMSDVKFNELVRDIDEEGFDEPIQVVKDQADGRFWIIGGEHR
ncbi:MAG: ParB N-terminal domain-containing protein, partial [Thaumarchaeota archaeon]|nr:ParB N-terminal domain-containing protein [Nitrososphaerota archaeon]